MNCHFNNEVGCESVDLVTEFENIPFCKVCLMENKEGLHEIVSKKKDSQGIYVLFSRLIGLNWFWVNLFSPELDIIDNIHPHIDLKYSISSEQLIKN